MKKIIIPMIQAFLAFFLTLLAATILPRLPVGLTLICIDKWILQPEKYREDNNV